ncbi:MAG: CysB family HTH-type transcriptional regulator [Gammaproteobacteria bacterium]|nr:CysB family HTH-type transcriptional regulator [Gammaproteobacteria bacterium]
MNIQQLRYIREVVRCGMNISTAANMLHTAQPGISHQIRLLEEELNVQIFERNGKRLVGLTQSGRTVLATAERILREIDNLKQVGYEFSGDAHGTLSIATTHTQARYALPKVIRTFTEAYPNIRLHMHQGNPSQLAQLVTSGVADIAIATEGMTLYEDLVTLSCYEWTHCVVAPPGLPILRETPLTLAAIAQYPIVTYDVSFAGRTRINEAFERAGLRPNVVFSAIDSDVIKTYVEIGLGIGLMARMAFDAERDTNLRMMDASHLFESSTTRIGLRRGAHLRGYMYAFIEMFAPQLDRKTVDAAMHE